MPNYELRMPDTRLSGTKSSFEIRYSSFARAFTLIELILVLALLVIITSLAAPAMANFIRGRALDSEARRLNALMHAAQSRAVSEGMTMVLWVDEKQNTYGLQAETTGKSGDAKSENLSVDSTLQIAVLNAGLGAPTTFNGLPAIRFLADGMVDENSPQTLQLTDSAGISRWLIGKRNRTGYEISDSKQ
ncbi:MAG TPA: GspH/FimT family protein [Verrucomicrobiae bacterium]|nr:GspH/FimT family protein [Verrucomicrobiae bacterium]